MIILDTNVVSETMQAAPSVRVMRWLANCPAPDTFLTSITEAEILTGIAIMPVGRRQNPIRAAWEKLVEAAYDERVLPFDSAAAQQYAVIVASRRRLGRPISLSDAQIAAIARSRGAILATRNLHDFEHCGIKVVNPFT